MRIGILCHPTYGGSGVVASELALSLAEKGHSVHLFSHDVPPRLRRDPGPVELHVAQGSPYPLFHSTPHDLAIMSRVLDLHRVDGLDILHAHYALPHAISALLVRAAALEARLGALKVVTTLHGTDITVVGNDPSYAPLTQYAITASDAVTAVSQDLADRSADNFDDAHRCGIKVIPNFVDLEKFQPRGERPPVATAIHVSNFRPVKRVPWLVEAFADALDILHESGAEAELVLVGDGPQQAEARRIARERGVCDHVKFLGMRDALPEVLSPADVFCLPSTEESFGLSALEAMACGTAVLGTRVGGVPEVVENGVSGLLVEVNDREAYSRHLAALLGDRERARTMGLAARERAAARFDRHQVVRAYEDLYRDLIHEDVPCPE
ncbi:MAG: N-acetyl-alpha-D-glucosaminyl L-malate synthase BshA [Planctomycetota bacterium]|jgi:N-acetyl-alpha-D-glucosaminyl L-malate synthase BshA